MPKSSWSTRRPKIWPLSTPSWRRRKPSRVTASTGRRSCPASPSRAIARRVARRSCASSPPRPSPSRSSRCSSKPPGRAVAWCANTPCCSIRRCLRRTAWPQRRVAAPAVALARPPARFRVPPRPKPSAAQPVAAGGGDSYEVQRGDSLSAIARRLSASTGARTDQLMVSIYRGNSGAFEGDMNRLRAGAVLRIPGSDEIAAVSPAEASAEVRRVAGSWAASSGAASAGRLRLVPPSDSASPARDRDNSAEVDALQGRVRELEGQLTESKRMLELRNTELADLQAKLAASQQRPRRQPRRRAAAASGSRQPADTVTRRAGGHDARSRRADARACATPAAEPPAATPTPEQQPAATDDRRGRAVAARLDPATYWWATGRRIAAADPRRGLREVARQAQDCRIRRPPGPSGGAGRRSPGASRWIRCPTPAACARRHGAAIPDDILVEESGTHRALQETQDIPLAPTVRTDETISSETAVNLDQGDPLAEADFHMAYGLYDQAADLVRIAIQREPHRRDLKLKLLEVFFVWGNKEQFLTMARELSETRRQSGRASGKRSSSWASRSRPKTRCSPTAARRWWRGGRRPEPRCRRCRRRRLRSLRCQRAHGRDRRRQSPTRSISIWAARCVIRMPPAKAWRCPIATAAADHARNDGEDDPGRLRSADRRTARAASDGRADDSREGRRRDAPQAQLRSDRRARARRPGPRTRLARTDGFLRLA